MRGNIQSTSIIFKGGLNLAASVLELQPGEAIQLFNYEVNTLGRYQRVLGYERFDGRLSPSALTATDLTGYPFTSDADELAASIIERDARRTAIQVVPGSGPIRGIVSYGGNVYAFRDSADQTKCNMYKSSGTGWKLVTTPTLAPGGRYEFTVANHGASSSTINLYGVDGKNELFEFDGASFTQIDGPIPGKFPTHVEVLASQVMVNAYSGGTFVFTAVGDFSDFLNGGEIGTGDEITGLDLQANNSMAVFCRNRTYVLYGTSKLDFQLQDLSKTTGAVEHSIQTIGDSIYLDDRGMTRLNRVQEFGNFDMATMSQKVEPLLQKYARRVTASFVIKEKNQYRVCFDDGTGLTCTFFGREVAGFSTFDYKQIVRCSYSGEDSNGFEVVYFGSDDGYVYQAEKGFSFDGNNIAHVVRPSFNSLGRPEVKKRWRKAVLEIDTTSKATITCIPEFDYSDPENPYHTAKEIVALGGGGYWDEGAWDEAKWSSASTFTADMYIDGVSRNMSITFSGSTNDEPPHQLNSLILHYSMKGRRR
jgi:hypothetical protein